MTISSCNGADANDAAHAQISTNNEYDNFRCHNDMNMTSAVVERRHKRVAAESCRPRCLA